MPYKLRQSLQRHASDVRVVCLIHEKQFVTSSRDMTSIVWEYNEDSNLFYPTRTLLGHKHFISSCCVLPPSEKHSFGLIVTGSHDKTICIYEYGKDAPMRIINGHENAVSALASLSSNEFVSGSWDSKIKLWHINSDDCLKTLNGHSASVFALLLLNSKTRLVSASADKLINVYKWPTLDFCHSLTGHTDCVRGLAPLSENNFLSCSNDGTIRHWNAETGMLTGIMFTHDSFLYSVASTEDASLIICGGEDNSVIILDKQGSDELLKLPALTIWSVCILPDRDIITGSSDGVVRIFTTDPKRQADPSEIARLEEKVKQIVEPSADENKKHDPLDTEKMKIPGPEALTIPGKSDGQILLVKENNKTECYQWSASMNNWILVGDVTGTNQSESSQAIKKSEKVLYEGKEYDYVFNIDVKAGSPPLKLPFMNGSNPYDVADAFLLKHDLPMTFRSEVVNFLLANTPSTSKIIQDPTAEEQDKYSFLAHANNFVSMTSIDCAKAKAKLIEFARLVEGDKERSSILWIDSLVEMAQSDVDPTEVSTILKKCLDWPQEYVYPILDLIRAAVLNATPNSKLCSEVTFDLISIFNRFTKENVSVVNNMLIIKVAVNMFAHRTGQKFCMKYKNLLLYISEKSAARSDKSTSLDIAISTLNLNMAVLENKNPVNYESMQECMKASFELLVHITNKPAMLRILTAIGIVGYRLTSVRIRETGLNLLKELACTSDNDDISLKIKQTSEDILHCIQSKLGKAM